MTDVESFARQRQQIARIAASPQFATSRQAREFLEYTAGRVFSGRTPVEQAEIALDVLGRKDFDPTSDAAVRKLATHVRERLRHYYEGPGASDELVVTLPLRSYAPRFEERTEAPRSAPSMRRNAIRVGALAMAAALAATFFWWTGGRAGEGPRDVRILTARGDISRYADAEHGAVRLGPELGSQGEVTARLTFRPDHEGQQAGLTLWESPSRWVSLSRRFTARNYISLQCQFDNHVAENPIHDTFDPEGQSGAPVWLRLRRDGQTFRGYWSGDGENWKDAGQIGVALGNARAGIFAVNGRRESPSIPADFHLPGVGAEAEAAPPAGDWSYTMRLDMQTSPLVSAGLFLRGTTGRVRLARYHAEVPAIALIHDARLLQSAPDYPGSPPVFLRLRTAGGKAIGEASVDGVRFRPVGSAVDLKDLGKLEAVGSTSWTRPGGESQPPPRVLFLRRDLEPLEWIRLRP